MNERNERKKWLLGRLSRGVTLLVCGIVIGLAGILIENLSYALPVPPRFLTGLGVLVAGIGLGTVIRYGSAMINEEAALRVRVDEGDERIRLIRARAGSRAYVASAGMIAAGLMWESFASAGSLPHISGDALWNALAIGLILPAAVYVLSLAIDQRLY